MKTSTRTTKTIDPMKIRDSSLGNSSGGEVVEDVGLGVVVVVGIVVVLVDVVVVVVCGGRSASKNSTLSTEKLKALTPPRKSGSVWITCTLIVSPATHGVQR